MAHVHLMERHSALTNKTKAGTSRHAVHIEPWTQRESDLPAQPTQPVLPNEGRISKVACLGASITAARGSFDWIAELQGRPDNRGFCFRRFSAGGDLAYNALGRLSDVVAWQPDKVVVLIGHNDVMAIVSRRARRILRRWKRLPEKPSPEWYGKNLRAIAQGLKRETTADIGLCSLFPIGEAPQSTQPFQRELNQRIEAFAAIIRQTADDEHVGYLPAYETMQQQIVASPGRAFTSFRILSFYRDAFFHRVLGLSLDTIARRGGWQFHTDGLHLNSCGGMLLVDLVQQFIDRPGARN
jgi:lysophospholipase L1-like esterase